jgi:para-nitrobenzyl esterase
MRAVPAEELLALARRHDFLQRAVDDGWLLPGQVHEIFAKGQQAPVPVITGYNRDESIGFVAPAESSAAYTAYVRKTFGVFEPDVLTLYTASGDFRAAQRDLAAYNIFGWRNETLARLTARAGQRAYLYQFAHTPPGMAGAFHTSEIAYVFGNLDQELYSANMKIGPLRPEDLRLSETMMKYWVAFARTAGDPAAMAGWAAYTESDRAYVSFEDGAAVARRDLLPGSWALFERINAARRGK